MRVVLRDMGQQSVYNPISVEECFKRIRDIYPGCITRGKKKQLETRCDFIILEVYRCMPLLGDEDNVPNWKVHIALYHLVFTNSVHQF